MFFYLICNVSIIYELRIIITTIYAISGTYHIKLFIVFEINRSKGKDKHMQLNLRISLPIIKVNLSLSSICFKIRHNRINSHDCSFEI